MSQNDAAIIVNGVQGVFWTVFIGYRMWLRRSSRRSRWPLFAFGAAFVTLAVLIASALPDRLGVALYTLGAVGMVIDVIEQASRLQSN
jgi:hypothetical protein